MNVGAWCTELPRRGAPDSGGGTADGGGGDRPGQLRRMSALPRHLHCVHGGSSRARRARRGWEPASDLGSAVVVGFGRGVEPGVSCGISDSDSDRLVARGRGSLRDVRERHSGACAGEARPAEVGVRHDRRRAEFGLRPACSGLGLATANGNLPANLGTNAAPEVDQALSAVSAARQLTPAGGRRCGRQVHFNRVHVGHRRAQAAPPGTPSHHGPPRAKHRKRSRKGT